MYRRFGSEVTIIGRAPHLAKQEDEDVSTAILAILEGEGINVQAERNLRGFSCGAAKDILAQVDCASGRSAR